MGMEKDKEQKFVLHYCVQVKKLRNCYAALYTKICYIT